jgi:hypothetical protein
VIAALYVDAKRGPYPYIPGVECWDEDRDATRYHGPHPVIAHPPCGHWGRYAHKAHDDGKTGPVAVSQVRLWGGVLEHPASSKLWKECGIPKPGELPDSWGGYTIIVEQGDFGHPAQKPTWLYVVGVGLHDLPPAPPRRPPPEDYGKTRGILEKMAKSKRHLTPTDFALWLVEIARRVRRPNL